MKLQLLVERLTIRAPRAGTVLQVNIRAGEYAWTTEATELPMLLETDQLQVRADVDEVNAPLFPLAAPGSHNKRQHHPADRVEFVRKVSSLISCRRSHWTGDNSERVDTRVLQVIYKFQHSPVPCLRGQQVDVFLNRKDSPGQPHTLAPGADSLEELGSADAAAPSVGIAGWSCSCAQSDPSRQAVCRSEYRRPAVDTPADWSRMAQGLPMASDGSLPGSPTGGPSATRN
ncbi:MAG: hypothetical protein U0361_07420 [Nitrospiraceae bacterium]